jgi:hypothetical protein
VLPVSNFEFLLRRIAAGDKRVALVGGTDFQLRGESNLADIYSMSEAGKTIHSEQRALAVTEHDWARSCLKSFRPWPRESLAVHRREYCQN